MTKADKAVLSLEGTSGVFFQVPRPSFSNASSSSKMYETSGALEQGVIEARAIAEVAGILALGAESTVDGRWLKNGAAVPWPASCTSANTPGDLNNSSTLGGRATGAMSNGENSSRERS